MRKKQLNCRVEMGANVKSSASDNFDLELQDPLTGKLAPTKRGSKCLS